MTPNHTTPDHTTPDHTTPDHTTPDALARSRAAALWATDQASAGLGMVLEHVAPGAARLSMVVQPRMLNGHGSCHGGFIFTLADSAFAFACNTGPAPRVASQCSVSFLRPVHGGQRMVAVAEQRFQEGRNGITDVRVTVDGTVVAEFRGHSRTLAPASAPHAA